MFKNLVPRFSALFLILFISFNSYSDDRSEEIRKQMWGSKDIEFQKTNVPDKWTDESAVIIAQLNRFEYKKPPVINELHANSIFHKRIKLNDKNAINEYAEISFLSSKGRKLIVHAGFKLIKFDGTELIIDNAEAVEMEQVEDGVKRSYKKLAIPNLEVGDILDYYICEDRVVTLATKIFYFTPVQYNLPQEYPVVNQKLEFSVQRRCFISLRSINGAPELEMEYNEETEEQQYTLVDQDREAVKELKWFYPNRELPTIKFRAAYASGKAVRQNDVLLGEPGVVKNEVTQEELSDFVSYLIINSLTDPKSLLKYVKKNVDKDADNFEKVKAGYYYQRNNELKHDEITTIADKEQWNENLAFVKDNNIKFLDRFSGFIANLDIPYDIVIAIPRNISSLEDLLLEPELRYLFRLKQGGEYLYLSDIENFSVPGELDSDLQGADAYIVDGLANFKDWKPQKITLPVTTKEDNNTKGYIDVNIESDFSKTNLSIKREITGIFKPYHQYSLLDYYDYEGEERKRYEMSVDFAGTLWMKKRLLSLRESYKSTRDKMKNDILKYLTEREFDFKISTVSDLKIEQTGRYDTNSEMVYSFKMETDDIVSKVGGNYLLNVGMLIEKQIKIEEDELERNHGIYMNSPRTYSYTISVKIPDGFQVQGLDKLENNVVTDQGGFVSSATINDNILIIESCKFYNNIKAEKDAWPELVKFLNVANQFTEQKVLLRKLNGI